MDERLKFIAMLLDGEQMAPLCREFGISRKTGYKILTRYNATGLGGSGPRGSRHVEAVDRLSRDMEDLAGIHRTTAVKTIQKPNPG